MIAVFCFFRYGEFVSAYKEGGFASILCCLDLYESLCAGFFERKNIKSSSVASIFLCVLNFLSKIFFAELNESGALVD